MKYYLIVIDNSWDGGGDIRELDDPPTPEELKQIERTPENSWCIILGEVIQKSENCEL
jgi:hypothetical protein